MCKLRYPIKIRNIGRSVGAYRYLLIVATQGSLFRKGAFSFLLLENIL